jgi:O-antigen/teichoic acid export membrane protein
MFIVFAAFGIPFYAIREVAMVRNEPTKKAALVKEMLLLHAAFTLFAMIAFCWATYPRWHDEFWLYAFALLNIFFSVFTVDWYLQGMEAFQFSATRYLLVRSTVVVCFFLFIHDAQHYTRYFAIHSCGLFVMAFLNSRKLWQETDWRKSSLQIKRHLKPLWHFFLTASAITLYIYFDTVLLEKITGNNTIVGYYTTAVKLVKVFLVGLLALGTVLLPRLSFLVSEGKLAEVKMHLQNNLAFIFVIGIPISTGIIFIAPEIMEAIAGKEFIAAYPLLQIMAALPLVIACSNLFCFQTLVPFKQEKKFLVVVASGCVVSIALNLLLIPFWGAAGSAWANLITETLIALFAAWFAHRVIPFDLPLKLLFQTLACSAIFIPIIWGIRQFTQHPYLIFAFAIVLCTLCYYLAQRVIFKNAILITIERYIGKFIRNKKENKTT